MIVLEAKLRGEEGQYRARWCCAEDVPLCPQYVPAVLDGQPRDE